MWVESDVWCEKSQHETRVGFRCQVPFWIRFQVGQIPASTKLEAQKYHLLVIFINKAQNIQVAGFSLLAGTNCRTVVLDCICFSSDFRLRSDKVLLKPSLT